MEGVKQVISAGIDLACTMTLNSQNYSDIKQVMHILAQAGVPQLTLTRFIPTGQGRLHPEMQITQKQLQSVLNLCWKMYHKESALPAISWGMPVPVCNLHSKVISLKIKPCCYGIDHFYVSPAGDLMHCGLLRQPLGNLFEMTFEEICTQSPLLNMLNKLNHLPPKCKTCEHLSRCGGGCRAMAYDNYSQYVELEPDGIPILAKEED
jgi:radical SAM protein with 4Fe4S-binding SPASM domain